MFTGIIEKQGKLKHKRTKTDMYELGFEVGELWTDLSIGESIAVNGVCLTVTRIFGKAFFSDVSQPTLSATNLGKISVGCSVNLERALKVGDRLGGHWVQGHVDGVGSVEKIVKRNDNIFVHIRAEKNIIEYLIHKGSVAVNGVSLTVQELGDDSFSVVVIPHTWNHTMFSDLNVHDIVNIEVDLISKYIKKYTTNQKRPLTFDYLQEQGY